MTAPFNEHRSIILTGASSGIGEALALKYAQQGHVLWLNGRNAERLKDVAARCRELGAEVHADTVDVTELDNMQQWITAAAEPRGIDLVVANAGISGGASGIGDEDETQVRDIFAVNLAGVLNTLLPALPIMQRQGHGHLALMSSIAGFRGLPTSPAYSASKAAVLAYGDGLRGELQHTGIDVSVICPGFVKSRITDANDFPMPFFMPTDKAANIIRRGLDKRRRRIAFPWQMRFAMWFIAAAPVIITDRFLANPKWKKIISIATFSVGLFQFCAI